MFETFSYLPPLSDDQIARQVDYIVNNGWTPCLEFSEPELAYVGSASSARMGPVSSVSNFAFVCFSNAICAKFSPNCAGAARVPRSIVTRSSVTVCWLPRLYNVLQNYFDNRYWTMWKLPMFGCTDPVQVGE